MGGQAVRRVTIPRKNWCRAGRVSAEMELRQSAERASVLSLTLPELFFAEPGDVVQLALEKLGVQGTFDVTEAENSQSADGTVCRLTMAERR